MLNSLHRKSARHCLELALCLHGLLDPSLMRFHGDPWLGWQRDCVLALRGSPSAMGIAEVQRGNGEGLDHCGEIRRKN